MVSLVLFWGWGGAVPLSGILSQVITMVGQPA